jgi:hypothetical protein
MNPGDMTVLRGGTYFFTGDQALTLNKAGTADAPFIFAAYPGETPIIDGTQGTGGADLLQPGTSANKGNVKSYGFWFQQARFHYFKGLTVQNIKGVCLAFWGGDNADNVFVDLTIQDCFWGGVDLFNNTAIRPANARNVFDRVTIQRTVKANAAFAYGHSGGWPSAFNMEGIENKIFRSTIRKNWGEGIGLYGEGPEARNNVLSDNYSVEIYVNNVIGGIADGNLITTTNDPAHYRTFSPGNEPLSAAVGIECANETAKRDSANNTITNNIVLGERRNHFFFWQGSQNVGLKSSLIANNVFAGKPVDMLMHWDKPATPHSGSTFANNVMYSLAAANKFVQPAPGLSFTSNAWFGGAVPSGAASAGDVLADPALTNGAGLEAASAMPKAGSPIVNAGITVDGVTMDFAGNPRPAQGAFDIGAFELTP